MKPSKVIDTLFGQRLALRVGEVNALGDQEPTVSGQRQFVIEGIVGTPEGRSLGKPGDLRVRLDVPQVWQKITGDRTKEGWQPLAAGSSAAGVMQELLLDISGVAMQPVSPVEGDENVSVPAGFTGAGRTLLLATGQTFLTYDDSVDELAATWQLAMPANYPGNGLEIVVELGGDGTATAEANMYAMLERLQPGADANVLNFGPEVSLRTEISGLTTVIQRTATITAAQMAGIVAGDAFRILIGRHPDDDPYAGLVTFFRGRLRAIA